MSVKLFQNNNDKGLSVPNEKSDTSSVVLSMRQVSWVVSGFLVLSFFIFMAGYFFGQRKFFADFTGKVEQESLGDMIFASLYTKDSTDGTDEEGAGESAAVADEQVLSENGDVCDVMPEQDLVLAQASLIESHPETINETKEASGCHYYAELVGFGTERAAQLFVERLQKDGISVDIKKRTSKTARGKLIAWYQVITPAFSDSACLLDLVKKLEKKEHLKGVTIQTCS